MSDTVNSQITDAVTITNTKVLAEAPAMAMGSLYQTIGNSVAMAAANAVYAQQQANVAYQAATTLAVTQLFNSNQSNDASGTPSIEELQAQINALTAKLAQLKNGSSGEQK
ncbi:RebB family R body protein [Undibacterium danionis]|uniref:RebB family R body protein n=1 Tax=Undibacterium danionis TaxID=1812100 RepID=A0ABV6IET9_9BURK